MGNDARTLLLALTLAPGVGPARLKAATDHLPDIGTILHLGRDGLAAIPGIGAKTASLFHEFLHSRSGLDKARDAAARQLEKLGRLGGTMLTLLDPEYPPLLREIYDPPACLFVRGTLPRPGSSGIAVVGTRRASRYGKECAERFCAPLARRGITIYSGLAYGIDMAAHTAALEAGGSTVAVLASGVDTIYTDPKGALWPRIIEHGALVSEEWIGSELSAGKFPKRNRIISGITSGTLVIESDEKGGSLITASNALEQNREVFAVPGSIFSKSSSGTNRLIQRGQAKAVVEPEDLLAEFGPDFARPFAGQQTAGQEGSSPASGEEALILQKMGEQPLHIDHLAAATGIGVSALLVHLFELECKGCIEQLPGQLFLRRP